MVRENWGSRFGFIMATAGFAIGMGNIWRFPYIVGESGGGAFIIVYLIIMYVSSIKLYNNIQLYNQLIYPLFQLLLFSMLYISYKNVIKR